MSRCSECADACPREALELGRGPPSVTASCDDCGVCGALCPTGAIDDLVAPLKGATVACAFADHRAQQRVSCLAALSLSRVAGTLGRKQGLQLFRASCQDCPRSRAAPAVEALLRRAGLLAASLGLGPEAVRASTVAAKAPEEPPATPRGGFSRRGFLELFRVRSTERGVRAAEDGRRVVLDTLSRQRAPLPAEARLAFRFHAPDGCDGCKVCVRLCPTGALKLPSTPEGCTLTFEVDRCGGCGLCVDVCRPPGARLEAVEAAVGALAPPSRPVEVVRLRRRTCEQCGAEFHSTPAASAVERCFVCADPARQDLGGGQVY